MVGRLNGPIWRHGWPPTIPQASVMESTRQNPSVTNPSWICTPRFPNLINQNISSPHTRKKERFYNYSWFWKSCYPIHFTFDVLSLGLSVKLNSQAQKVNVMYAYRGSRHVKRGGLDDHTSRGSRLPHDTTHAYQSKCRTSPCPKVSFSFTIAKLGTKIQCYRWC